MPLVPPLGPPACTVLETTVALMMVSPAEASSIPPPTPLPPVPLVLPAIPPMAELPSRCHSVVPIQLHDRNPTARTGAADSDRSAGRGATAATLFAVLSAIKEPVIHVGRNRQRRLRRPFRNHHRRRYPWSRLRRRYPIASFPTIVSSLSMAVAVPLFTM